MVVEVALKEVMVEVNDFDRYETREVCMISVVLLYFNLEDC